MNNQIEKIRNDALGDVSKATTNNPAPLVSIYEKKGGGLKLLRNPPLPENLAMPGGGGRGVGYGPVLKVLSETGALDGVKFIHGASAGALAASLLAAGMTPEKFDYVTGEKIDASELKNDLKNFTERYGKFVSMGPSNVGYHSGQKALDILDREISTTVHELLNDKFPKGRELKNALQEKLGEEEGLLAFERLSTMRDTPFEEDGSREDLMVTFKDLANLVAIDPAGPFKDLTLYATSKGEEQVLNARETPDMPVAIGARASMSIPLYFRTITFEGKTYSDGGVHVNQPSRRTPGELPNTLPLVFADGTPGKGNEAAYKAAHNQAQTRGEIVEEEGTLQERTMNVAKAIGTKAVDLATSARAEAYLQMSQRIDSGIGTDHDNAKSVAAVLTAEEKDFVMAKTDPPTMRSEATDRAGVQCCDQETWNALRGQVQLTL